MPVTGLSLLNVNWYKKWKPILSIALFKAVNVKCTSLALDTDEGQEKQCMSLHTNMKTMNFNYMWENTGLEAQMSIHTKNCKILTGTKSFPFLITITTTAVLEIMY